MTESRTSIRARAREARERAEFMTVAETLMVELEAAKEAVRQARGGRDAEAYERAVEWLREQSQKVHEFRRYMREVATERGER